MNQMIHMERVNKSHPEEITAEKGLSENWKQWCNKQRGKAEVLGVAFVGPCGHNLNRYAS